jgi:NAD(P)-dependent dehydrogenase (short-subunit alcohol dehydrogenase family)
MSKTVLVTGANRGLGLEFARQLKDGGHTVIGTARHPDSADDLRDVLTGEHDRLEQLDVDSEESVAALAAALRSDGRPIAIDLLINNGAVSGNRGGIADLDMDGLTESFRINAVGPMRVIKHLLPNLRAGTGNQIVSISSQLGSITNANGGSSYGYRASKAALNMLNKHLSVELKEEGFTCMVLHPGWVQTRMGGQEAPLTPPESIAGMLKVIKNAKPETHNGAFLDYKGETLPW